LQGVATFRPVSLGREDGRRRAVLKGLEEGEMVVVNPAGLEPGKKIRPEIKAAAGQNN
jgi:hypothetical protein